MIVNCRYGLPQTSMSYQPSNHNQLPRKIFGNYALKTNMSNQISPNPLIALCRNYKNQNFEGYNLSGFSTKFCQDFYLAPTDVGVCISKNLDLKKIIKLEDVYHKFFETENQSSELKVETDNYWAISTYVINPLKIDPMKVKVLYLLHCCKHVSYRKVMPKCQNKVIFFLLRNLNFL